MNFRSFIKELPQQEDQDIHDFIELVKKDQSFPKSSDPDLLAQYLFAKLNENQTRAFQQLFLAFMHTPKNDLPIKLKENNELILQAVNKIVQLQNGNQDVISHNVPKATKSRQVICLYPIEFPTQEGGVYLFTVKDVYNDYIFITGTEQNMGYEAVIKNVLLLMEHEDFKSQKPENFTLVLHKYEQIRHEIEAIIRPIGGHLCISDPYISIHMPPVIEFIYKQLSKNQQ